MEVFSVLESLKMTTVFEQNEAANFYIPADIELRDDSYLVTADIPNGVKKEDIKLSFEMDVLTIEAESHPEKKGRIINYYVNGESNSGHKIVFEEGQTCYAGDDKDNTLMLSREPMTDEEYDSSYIFDNYDLNNNDEFREKFKEQSATDEKEGKQFLLEELGHRIYKRCFKFHDVDPHGISAKFSDTQLIVCLKKFKDNNIQISFSDEPNPVCRPKK